ncbi:cell division protein FtsQ/DivIB [Desulfoplanes sp. PS50]
MRKKTAVRRSNAYRSNPGLSLARRMLSWVAFWFRMGIGMVFIGIVSVGLLYAYRYVTEQSFFALDEVIVSGNSHREDATLVKLGGIELGKNIFDLSISEIQQQLLKDPWIEKASVRRVLPDRLEILVRERQACFWVTRKNHLWYADRRGEEIDRVEPAHFISLPVLGGSGEEDAHRDALSRIVELMDANSLPFGFAAIDSMWLKDDGSLELLLNQPRMSIRIGVNKLETNCRRLALAWGDLGERRELQKVKSFQAVAGKVWVTVG